MNPATEPWNLDIVGGIDRTPLIDVLFMLIVFFILAGTFSK